ncbi:Dimethylaniline monooxygenase [N-oxide-forming] 5 [Fusarium oxysporum f. sp. cubense race 1]|uniref:Dimethylaniline monooxygenase [N-oxide-forming] 5 n=1 Tax=Fusarium oxysporum f. sp. cubense (strain race 1) TaxID=1229664 RepID=N4UUD8_FUSC1|nr:Dimethylaniline monooxygenase [N-oxide-forming] 5 [Fusarium oxysporum f. sp. cubense race 1]
MASHETTRDTYGPGTFADMEYLSLVPECQRLLKYFSQVTPGFTQTHLDHVKFHGQELPILPGPLKGGLYPATLAMVSIDGKNVAQIQKDGTLLKAGRDLDRKVFTKNVMHFRSWAIYPTKNPQVWYQIMRNLDPAGFLRAYGLDPTLETSSCDESYEVIKAEMIKYSAEELEQKNMEHGFCGQTCYTFAQWRETTMDRRPLAGVKVVELARAIAGPAMGAALAALGADVIKVQSPNLPDLQALSVSLTAGKRTYSLDLTVESDRQKLHGLIGDADVIIQAFRLRSLERKGFDGYYAERPEFQQIADAASGCSYVCGKAYGFEQGTSVLPPLPIADMLAGAVGVIDTMLALRDRAKSGGSYHAAVALTAVDAVQLEQEVGLYPPETVKIQDTYKFALMTPDLHIEELLYILSDSWAKYSDILHRGYMVEFETAWGKIHNILSPIVQYENENIINTTAPSLLRHFHIYYKSGVKEARRKGKMKHVSVAIIGAGPTGISMLKQLLQDGFSATLFERRSSVGGLWAYDANNGWTTALASTSANISKYTCGFTDFPIPDKYPVYLSAANFQEFMQSYAEYFKLTENISFNSSVQVVNRNSDDSGWVVQVEKVGTGETESRPFDKVVFCHGYQTQRVMPTFPGQDKFEGEIIHSQQYRSPEAFRDKTVVILGLSTTTGEITPQVISTAKKVYVSHRSGQMMVKRMRKGRPTDLLISWRRRQITQWMARNVPNFYRYLAGWGARLLSSQFSDVKLDPEWRIQSFRNPTLRLPGLIQDIVPHLQDGSLTSLHGVKRFLGGRSIEFDDGTVVDDVDSVILTTGYRADFSVAPFIEKSMPKSPSYQGPAIQRLYMNVFPPKYADSCAVLCYSAYGKNNGFSFSDVMNMAISNIWRGVSKLRPYEEMEKWVDEHQKWVAANWAREPHLDVSMVKQYEFQPWMHEQAGTGMENLGWGWAGWKFWWKDREMYNLMNHGVETAHMFRYFETGKRKTWEGARDEIIRQNRIVEESFSGKNKKLREE